MMPFPLFLQNFKSGVTHIISPITTLQGTVKCFIYSSYKHQAQQIAFHFNLHFAVQVADKWQKLDN